jgi:phospholipase C
MEQNTLNRVYLPLHAVIAYDDSDGWYDHVMPPIVSQEGGTAASEHQMNRSAAAVRGIAKSSQ